MIDRETAIKEAKDLAEFCSGQFCPDCVFNKSTCMLGSVGFTPSTWNTMNLLDNLEEEIKNNEWWNYKRVVRENNWYSS